jgi:glyoxylase-like metal-dependent hydrolase (beta-lactamase superfamily II)
VLIESRSLWYFGTNTYVVGPDRGGPAVIIDAPPDPTGIGDLLAEFDLTPLAVLVTHGHIDHAGGVDGVVTSGVAAYIHPDDIEMARHPGDQLRALLGAQAPDLEGPAVSAPFEHLTDTEVLELAGVSASVIHTPGHTPGHCCFHLVNEGVLFSGDQLFAGSIGRTDLPGGSYEQLMKSMEERVLPLPAETRVLPGHGPATTLAAERSTNPFLQELT